MGISSDSLAGSSGPWSYFTADGVRGDAELCSHIRENTKFLLYALANSNAMNGLNETSTVVNVMTWWRAAYLGLAGVMGVLTVAFGAAYVVNCKKAKKEAAKR